MGNTAKSAEEKRVEIENEWWNAARLGDAKDLARLLRAGVDVDAEDENGRSAATWAAARGNFDCLDLLVKAGCDLEARDGGPGGWTLAMLAANAEDPAALKMLIEAGADIEAVDLWGVTAAMLAASRGFSESLGALVEAGCDVQAVSRDGLTAMIAAVQSGHAGCADLLRGALARIEAGQIEEGLEAGPRVGKGPLRV